MIPQGGDKPWIHKKFESLWDDLRVSVGEFSVNGGGNDPTVISWRSVLSLTAFRTNDELAFAVQMPHRYKQGTDLRLHLHWTPHVRGVAEIGKTVAWKVDLVIGNPLAGFSSLVTYDLTDIVTGIDDYHEIDSSVTVPGAGLTVSHMIIGRIYRDAGDTWVGSTAAQSPALLEMDFHYEIDLPGSDLEFSKT